MGNNILHLQNTRDIEIEEGWGVSVMPVYADDENRIVEIDVTVYRIALDNIEKLIGLWCVKPVREGDGYVPVENFQHVDDLTNDDTHDLRTRWFATEQEARDWAGFVERRWKNPQPWESFVQL